MTLSSAMLTGFSGIKSNQFTVDTVGNNLANLNTTAFKGDRTLFETLLYQDIDEGSGPEDVTGGRLPTQIGFGSRLSDIQRSFLQGNIEGTAFPDDLAIDGEGLFVVNNAAGEQRYTRDGSFRLDESQTLVSASGDRVQVFQANADNTIDANTLGDLTVPLGSSSAPQQTAMVQLDGHLDAGTGLATTGAVVSSQPLVTAGGTAASGATRLVDLVDANGISVFEDGDALSITGRKGGIDANETTFAVATGTTLDDLASHLRRVYGINTDVDPVGSAGVAIENGTLVLRSNPGETNAIQLDEASIRNTTRITDPPFAFLTVEEPVGEAVSPSSFNVYDSLGNTAEVRLRYALESRSDAGTTWRFYAESLDDSDLSPVIGTGTVSFDTNGRFIASTGTNLTIDRADSGSNTPINFDLDFTQLSGHSNPDGESQVVMDEQDGHEAGIMIGYRVERDGTVIGSFDNNEEITLGQIALALFTNQEGLVGESDNLFREGPGSGAPTILQPLTNIAGSIRSQSLERSNVEISREFINLISASTGIQSASRVVRTADQLLQQLLLIAR